MPTGALQLACDGNSPCDDRFAKREIAFRKQFRNRGWYETVLCMPSGACLCYQQFYDINGRGLAVVTESGSLPKIPSVVKFYYADLLDR